jgi:hypothetical protein
MIPRIQDIFVQDPLHGAEPKYQLDSSYAEEGMFFLNKDKLPELVTTETITIPLHKVSNLYKNRPNHYSFSQEVEDIILSFILNIKPFFYQKIITNGSDLQYFLNSSCDNVVLCHPSFRTEINKYNHIRYISSSLLQENEIITFIDPEFTGCIALSDKDNSFGVFLVKKDIKRIQFVI